MSQTRVKELLEDKIIKIIEISFNPILKSCEIYYAEENGIHHTIEFAASRRKQKNLKISFWDDKEGFEYHI